MAGFQISKKHKKGFIMSLDLPPVNVANPPSSPAIVVPAQPQPTTLYVNPPSTYASGLGGAQGISSQANNNTAQNQTVVNNRNTVIQDIRGSRTSVGDISFDQPSLYFNVSTDVNGNADAQAGIIIPLGGHKIRRSAATIAIAKADASVGAVCKSIRDAGFTAEMVAELYPKSPQYRVCVRAAEVVASADLELVQLRLEVAEMRARLRDAQATRPMKSPVPREHPSNTPVRGLW